MDAITGTICRKCERMSRYIDADIIRDEWLHGGENEHIYDTNDFLDSIDYQPTADVEQVRHAHWVLFNGELTGRIQYKCSICDSKWGIDWMHYCPHCGAKMDENVEI